MFWGKKREREKGIWIFIKKKKIQLTRKPFIKTKQVNFHVTILIRERNMQTTDIFLK